MTLTEILQKLSYGPLSELPIVGEGTGTVPEANIPRLVLAFNNTLTALYSRFPLSQKTLVIAAVDGIYQYALRKEFAQSSGSSELNKYIIDTMGDPFLGDVLMVTDVYDGNHCALPMNDREDKWSWFVSSFDTLRMDYPRTGESYFIDYRARHPEIPLVPLADGDFQIRLPAQLEQAFMHKVAGEIYGAMSMEGALAKSRLNFDAYEAECAFHENQNTFHTSVELTNTKPKQGGWPR